MLFISVLGFLVHVIYLPMMCQPKYLPNILWIFEYMSWQRLQKCAGTCTLKGGIMLKKPSLRFPGLCEDSQSRGSRPYEHHKYWRYNTEAVTFGIY